MMLRLAEFKRNLWQEFSLQRLVVMPLILGGILYLSHLMIKDDPYGDYATAMQSRISWLYMLLVLIWGTRQVARGINEELTQRTWDFQRMSSLSAGEMLLGKCFGSTAYAWYGGLILIAVYTGYDIYAGTYSLFIITNILHFILFTIFTHASVLMFALLMLRNAHYRHKPRGVSLYMGLVLVITLPVYSLSRAFTDMGLLPGGNTTIARAFESIHWYGFELYSHSFVVASIAGFTCWALLGAYRMLAAELQYKQWALGWPAFVVFLCVYTAGFVWGIEEDTLFENIFTLSTWSIVALMITANSIYACAFFDPLDTGRYHALHHARRTRAWGRLLELLPWWFSSFVLYLIVVLAGESEALINGVELGKTATLIGALTGFMLRDIAIVHFLSFGGVRRLKSAFFVYLAVLYMLAPALLYQMQYEIGVSALTPHPEHPLVSLISAWAQAAVFIGLCAWRWMAAKPKISA